MNYAEDLSNKIWKTKGARFEAHKRLLKMNKLSTLAIILNSAIVIILSLFSMNEFNEFSKFRSSELAIVTIFLSVLIIVVSVLEGSKNYSWNAELHHQCGKELNKLKERLAQIMDKFDENFSVRSEVEDLGNRYQEILDSYTINHTAEDYNRFTLVENKEIGVASKMVRLFFNWFITYFWVLISFLFPILFVLIFVLRYK